MAELDVMEVIGFVVTVAKTAWAAVKLSWELYPVPVALVA